MILRPGNASFHIFRRSSIGSFGKHMNVSKVDAGRDAIFGLIVSWFLELIVSFNYIN
jgi:hypothetical protein